MGNVWWGTLKPKKPQIPNHEGVLCDCCLVGFRGRDVAIEVLMCNVNAGISDPRLRDCSGLGVVSEKEVMLFYDCTPYSVRSVCVYLALRVQFCAPVRTC